MKVTFYFSGLKFHSPYGIEIDVDVLPRKGDHISFDGDLQNKIGEWEDREDDLLVVVDVHHYIYTDKPNSIVVTCGMSKELEAD